MSLRAGFEPAPESPEEEQVATAQVGAISKAQK